MLFICSSYRIGTKDAVCFCLWGRPQDCTSTVERMSLMQGVETPREAERQHISSPRFPWAAVVSNCHLSLWQVFHSSHRQLPAPPQRRVTHTHTHTHMRHRVISREERNQWLSLTGTALHRCHPVRLHDCDAAPYARCLSINTLSVIHP